MCLKLEACVGYIEFHYYVTTQHAANNSILTPAKNDSFIHSVEPRMSTCS